MHIFNDQENIDSNLFNIEDKLVKKCKKIYLGAN